MLIQFACDMFIYSGLGFIVGLVGFGCLLATEYLSERWTQNELYYQQHPLMISVGFLAAGLVIAVVTWLFRPKLSQPGHSFFFIPVTWWPQVFFTLAALVAVFSK